MFEDGSAAALWLALNPKNYSGPTEISRFQQGRLVNVIGSKHLLPGGVILKEVRGHRKSQIFGTSDGVPPGRVWTIFHEHAGSIWVGGEGGPSKFDNDRFRTLSQSNGPPAEFIFGMAEDDDGYWWIATDVGVLRVPAGADRQLDGVM